LNLYCTIKESPPGLFIWKYNLLVPGLEKYIVFVSSPETSGTWVPPKVKLTVQLSEVEEDPPPDPPTPPYLYIHLTLLLSFS
jgi:hypothetical protein